jgi:hypothetical protein
MLVLIKKKTVFCGKFVLVAVNVYLLLLNKMCEFL